jgi:hypothetical protein
MRNVLKSDLKIIIVLIILIFNLQLVNANGAKPVDSPEASGGVIFDSNSGISLVEETIEFSQFKESLHSYAKVTVDYELKNLQSKNQQFDILFIIPELDSNEDKEEYKVYANNNDITDSSVYESVEYIENWSPTFSHGLKEPYSEEIYDEGISARATGGIRIPLTMDGNDRLHLRIEYLCEGGYARLDEYEKTIFSFIYFLTPAEFWSGDPKIKLNIRFPSDEDIAFYSNMPMKEISRNYYTCTLNKLPAYEWMFTYINRSGLIYGTNDSKLHTMITAIISISIYIIALLSYYKLKKRYIINLGYTLSVMYFLIFGGKLNDGNIGDAFLYLFYIVIFIIIVPVSYLISNYLIKRKLDY